ncbi:uncharacterized protein LOC129567328 [Sitodiplosis mosellana]|uniref:uncharacterized protein LOC129567328 n=1 Tax=Sitodiplosis mosellana TaxID=263140 RepID=UPI0024440D61|nr:uncharacterized protein LOC129567328 [Sitodiplosis mosellana]
MAKIPELGLNIPFCCCFDLRTGGLVVGYIDLIYTAMLLLSANIVDDLSFGLFLLNALLLGVYGSWVYGVHTESTRFMIPAVVLGVIYYGLCLVVLALIPIFGIAYGAHFYQLYLPEIYELHLPQIYQLIPNFEKQLADLGAALVYIVFIFWGLATAFQWLFTAVKYSLYKRMVEANQSNADSSVNVQYIGA